MARYRLSMARCGVRINNPRDYHREQAHPRGWRAMAYSWRIRPVCAHPSPRMGHLPSSILLSSVSSGGRGGGGKG